MTQRIRTATEAINALGGTYAVAALFNEDARVISNWRRRGLPPNTYEALAPLLRKRGLRFAVDELFGQRLTTRTRRKLAEVAAKSARIRTKPHRSPRPRKNGNRKA
jgi:hypothetical protein